MDFIGGKLLTVLWHIKLHTSGSNIIRELHIFLRIQRHAYVWSEPTETEAFAARLHWFRYQISRSIWKDL